MRWTSGRWDTFTWPYSHKRILGNEGFLVRYVRCQWGCISGPSEVKSVSVRFNLLAATLSIKKHITNDSNLTHLIGKTNTNIVKRLRTPIPQEPVWAWGIQEGYQFLRKRKIFRAPTLVVRFPNSVEKSLRQDIFMSVNSHDSSESVACAARRLVLMLFQTKSPLPEAVFGLWSTLRRSNKWFCGSIFNYESSQSSRRYGQV